MTVRITVKMGLLKFGPEEGHSPAEELVPPKVILLVDQRVKRERKEGGVEV